MASSSSKPEAAEPGDKEDDALDAMGRKVWDKDFYVERAKNNIMFGPERIGRRKDPVIPLPSSQRTYLKQRGADLQLDRNLGKTQVITAHTIKPMQGGYWCSVCECLLKDSSTYLEHVNGRRHNRNLGMNMKVEKVGVDRVREKLKAMRKGPEEEEEAEDIALRIQRMEEEQEEKKLRKKENKKKKKGGAKRAAGEGGDGEGDEPSAKKPRGEDDGEEDDDDEEEETEEQKMLKMMGLPTGFG